jgi:hypothetical protein
MISNKITDNAKTDEKTIVNVFNFIIAFLIGAFLALITNTLLTIITYVFNSEISVINDNFYSSLIHISLLTTLLIAITILVAVSPFAYYIFRNVINYFRKREESYLFDYESLAKQIFHPTKLIYKIRRVTVWILSVLSFILLISSAIFLAIVLLGN